MKRRFEVASPPPASQQHRLIEDMSFSAALDRQQPCKKSRQSERKRRAAPLFQGELPKLMLRLRHMDIALYSDIAVVFVIGVVKPFSPLFNSLLIFM